MPQSTKEAGAEQFQAKGKLRLALLDLKYPPASEEWFCILTLDGKLVKIEQYSELAKVRFFTFTGYIVLCSGDWHINCTLHRGPLK